MEQQQQAQPQNPLAGMTADSRKALVAGLMFFPALTVQLFIRSKTGFRHLKPVRLVILTLLMVAFGIFLPAPPSEGRAGSTDASAFFVAPAYPESKIPPGLDAPLPAGWDGLNYGQRVAWVNQHRLSPQQAQERAQREQQERERLLAEARAKAERAAQWAGIRAQFSRWPIFAFALAFLGFGLYQRRARWNDLVKGVRWHTRSRGIPALKTILGKSLSESHIVRFADPAAVFIAGLGILYVSRALGVWVMFSGFALYIVEQAVYEAQLERELDMLDNLVDAETMSDMMRQRNKGQEGLSQNGPTIEESGGVLSTSATVPDLVAKREQREGRALRSREREDDLFAEISRSMAELPPQQPGKVNGRAGSLAAHEDRL